MEKIPENKLEQVLEFNQQVELAETLLKNIDRMEVGLKSQEVILSCEHLR